MFKNILIPISSEFYSKQLLQKSISLAEKFESNLNIVYIIEEKTLAQTNKRSDAYRTFYEIEETKNEIIRKQKQTADDIIFKDAKYFFKNKKIPFKEKIKEGEFSKVVRYETIKEKYDLILMGFAKGCILNYSLLDEIDIPVWVEGKGSGKSILAVCSNLAPNQKVPNISIELSNILGWKLNMLYVVDVEDSVQVDENCKRSDKKSEKDLIFKGQYFVKEMEDKGIKIEMVKGNLEKETTKAAMKIEPNLIIVGREQKKRGVLGLPVKNIKKKMVEKCNYSILFVN